MEKIDFSAFLNLSQKVVGIGSGCEASRVGRMGSGLAELNWSELKILGLKKLNRKYSLRNSPGVKSRERDHFDLIRVTKIEHKSHAVGILNDSTLIIDNWLVSRPFQTSFII